MNGAIVRKNNSMRTMEIGARQLSAVNQVA